MAHQTIYTDLNKGQIRLLSVQRLDSTIHCHLHPISLKYAPPFDALSYAWDKIDNRPSSNIVLNGEVLEVWPNLHDALIRLDSYLPETSDTGLVWIDALCINQSNRAEKSTQLPLMSDIYSSARHVLIFLGKADKNSDIVMERMSELGLKLSSFGPGFAASLSIDELPSHGLPDRSDELWSSIGHFCRRGWWERLWILQEVILAKLRVVLCGDKVIDWEVLARFITALVKTELKNLALAKHNVRKDVVDAFSTVPQVDLIASSILLRDIPSLFQVGRLRKCEMKVDRMWGFIGVMGQQDREHIHFSQWIQYPEDAAIDDNLGEEAREARKQGPYWASYLKVTRWALETDKTLRLLSYASSSSRHVLLPSWCPDWSCTQDYNAFGDVRKYRAGIVPDADSVSSLVAFADPHRLGIYGYKADSVKKTIDDKYCFTWSQFPAARRGALGSAAKVLEWEAKCLELSHETYPLEPLDAPLEEHWRTIVGDKIDAEDTRSLPDFFSLTYQKWKDLLLSLKEDRVIGMEEHDRKVVNAYSHWVENACEGRKFFNTTGGRIGIGPMSLKEGDDICVLENARPLFILRQGATRDAYKLIGDAFVFGLMSGQGMRIERVGRDVLTLV